MHILFASPLPFFKMWVQVVAIDETRQGKNNEKTDDDNIELPVLLVDLAHELLLQP